jgi:hypothetical protein
VAAKSPQISRHIHHRRVPVRFGAVCDCGDAEAAFVVLVRGLPAVFGRADGGAGLFNALG